MSTAERTRSQVLTFLLPAGADLVAANRAPDLFGCLYEIGRRIGLVTVYGRSKEAVFAQAGEILRLGCAQGRHAFTANLYTVQAGVSETRDWMLVGGGAIDGWTVVVIDGQAAFAPTALGAEFPLTEDAPVVTATPATSARP